MVQNLPDLSLNPGLCPQHLASFDVQEAEGINGIKSVEELHLRKGDFSVILRLPERNTGLRRKIIFSRPQKPRKKVVSHTTWVATH